MFTIDYWCTCVIFHHCYGRRSTWPRNGSAHGFEI